MKEIIIKGVEKMLFGFIGAGNMGGAMLRGAIGKYGAENFIVSTATEASRERLKEELHIRVAENNQTVAESCKYCILAVKPYFFPDVLPEIAPVLRDDSIVISVAAGVTIAQMKEVLGENRRIVRTMPNTPAAVGEAMTGISFDDSVYTEEERKEIFDFFASFGKAEEVKESLLNAVICVSGSSPAYVYMFIESLADSAVRAGLPRKKAYEMAAQTVLGAAKMVLETGKHPGELKDAVCSPGGTTIAGVAALEEYGLRNAVLKASEACMKRAEELNKKA